VLGLHAARVVEVSVGAIRGGAGQRLAAQAFTVLTRGGRPYAVARLRVEGLPGAEQPSSGRDAWRSRRPGTGRCAGDRVRWLPAVARVNSRVGDAPVRRRLALAAEARVEERRRRGAAGGGRWPALVGQLAG
jgi:hypothetical protein